MKDFKEKLALVPRSPGCYLMKDETGEVIYVGKAKILQNRLRSYFTGTHTGKTRALVEAIDDFEYILTHSELEAFLLECNLIKNHRPKYNILLMDDSTYPYIYITKEKNPKILQTREPAKFTKRGNGHVYGPYPNVKACRDVVDLLNKVFPLRKCDHLPKKPCLYYAMGQCLAPCINDIKTEQYDHIISQIHMALTSSSSPLYLKYQKLMEEASEALEFEKAIYYRDLLNSIDHLLLKQKMTSKDLGNRDCFGFYCSDGYINMQVFHVRYGKVIERSSDLFELYDSSDEVVSSYILQFYMDEANITPSEIIVPDIVDTTLLQEALGVKVTTPKKGSKKALLDLVCQNCQDTLELKRQERMNYIQKTTETVSLLGNLLKMPYPKRIELFDNSNISGTYSVSAMVCYVDGVPSKSDYRRYKVKTIQGADDFHTMIEVITRRYKRVLKENLTKPNLIIVDGGAPQISAAKSALQDLGIQDIKVVGLAKDDNHRTRCLVNTNLEEIPVERKSNLFLLLEAMQDEVHRFAITYFRKTIAKSTTASLLDQIDGIGKVRKQKILEHFSNYNEMQEAPVSEYISLGIPEKVAIKIVEQLKEAN